eukprot:1544212-Rhodomonas_salina.2
MGTSMDLWLFQRRLGSYSIIRPRSLIFIRLLRRLKLQRLHSSWISAEVPVASPGKGLYFCRSSLCDRAKKAKEFGRSSSGCHTQNPHGSFPGQLNQNRRWNWQSCPPATCRAPGIAGRYRWTNRNGLKIGVDDRVFVPFQKHGTLNSQWGALHRALAPTTMLL